MFSATRRPQPEMTEDAMTASMVALWYTAKDYNIQRLLRKSTKSIIPLSVVSGNKNPTQYPVFCLSLGLVHSTLGRIERDSQDWTRRRSRSSHCPVIASPMVCLMSAPTTKEVKREGTLMEICRRSRCSAVMVRSVPMTHLMPCDLYRKATPLSLVALERSIEAAPKSPGYGRELPVRVGMPNEHTTRGMGNVEEFEGIRTFHHQVCDPPEIFLDIPRECELSETKTVRQVQQLAHSTPHPSIYIEVKGSTKRWRDHRDTGCFQMGVVIVHRRLVTR